MKKNISYILALASTLAACTNDSSVPCDSVAGSPQAPIAASPQDLCITADMQGSPATRISYAYDPYFYEDDEEGNITARWELGDVLRVYETDSAKYSGDKNNTHVYPEYEDYEKLYPYPSAPVIDKYYRFECVGGAGTSHGIFKYIGLTTATVVAGTLDHDSYNVNLDIEYKHDIRNWEKFDGLVIFGSPLRNYMMRHQTADRDFQHMKYGVRMKGHFCSYNFNTWYNGGENADAGANGLLLYITESCVFRVIMGGLDRDLYGGGEVTLTIPGVAPEPAATAKSEYRKNPLSLSLGSIQEHQELLPPWATANPNATAEHTTDNTITAYVVGWDGTIASGTEITVSLKDHFFGIEYKWKKKLTKDFILKEGYYYTLDLRRKPDVIDYDSVDPYIPE